jgi:hypothetical protein
MFGMSLRIGLLLAFFITVAGCAAPSIAPIVQTGEGLEQAISTAQATVAADLQLLDPPRGGGGGGGDPELGEAVDQLREAWRFRLAAAAALTGYIDALASLHESGLQGAASARQVAAAAQDLLTALAGPTMPAPYVHLAASLYGCVAQARAARSLEAALAAADGAVQAICLVLDRDLEDLDAILAATAPELERRYRLPHAALVSHRMGLERRRSDLETQLAAAASEAEFARIADELAQVASLIDATRDRYEPLLQRIAAMRARLADHRSQLAATSQQLAALAEAHRRLSTGK